MLLLLFPELSLLSLFAVAFCSLLQALDIQLLHFTLIRLLIFALGLLPLVSSNIAVFLIDIEALKILTDL